MTLKGTSQTLDSVTCIPNVELRKAINLIEVGKITKQELDSTIELVNYLNKRIDIKDSILLKYAQKDQYWKKLNDNHDIQINNLKQVVDNDAKIFHIQGQRIKSQKRQKWLFFILGATTTYFITKH